MEQTNLLSDLERSAKNAYHGTSFSPERRGKQLIEDYTAELLADIATIEQAAKGQDSSEQVQRYTLKYKAKLSAWLSSESNVISPMIAGPSKFPFARMEKRRNWAQNHYSAFRAWRQRALKGIAKSFTPKEAKTNDSELERYEAKLRGLEECQERMKAANKVIRTSKTDAEKAAALVVIGFTEQQAEQLQKEDWFGYKGFAPFSLTNNSSEIRRVKAKIEEIKRRIITPVTEVESSGGVSIVDNTEANRLQIFFPDKPNEEIRQMLKKNGFRWTPSAGCWQSYRNAWQPQRAQTIIEAYAKQ